MNRHIILTAGRSGSNYLRNVLNQHSHLVNYGEFLTSTSLPYKLYDKCKKYRVYRGTIVDYLDYIYNSKTFFYAAQLYSAYSHLKKKKVPNFKTWKQIYSIGTKDFFLNYQNKNALDFLISNEDIAVIHLYRSNLLRRYLSLVFLKETSLVSTEKKLAGQKMTIDVVHMMTYLNVLDKEKDDEEKIIKKLKNHRILTIRYEDYFVEASMSIYNDQIFEFLGVESFHLKSQHKKILSPNMHDLVNNYDEFCACLANTKYQKYLD